MNLWSLYPAFGLALVGLYLLCRRMSAVSKSYRCGCPVCAPEQSTQGSFRARQAKAARRASEREIKAMLAEVEGRVAG